MINTHEQKSFKQRLNTLLMAINQDASFQLNFRYVGLVTTTKGPKLNKDGFYDVDVDLIISSGENAELFFEEFNKLLIKHKGEFVVSNKSKRKTALLSIKINDLDNRFRVDVAIFNAKTREVLTQDDQGVCKWESNKKPKEVVKAVK